MAGRGSLVPTGFVALTGFCGMGGVSRPAHAARDGTAVRASNQRTAGVSAGTSAGTSIAPLPIPFAAFIVPILEVFQFAAWEGRDSLSTFVNFKSETVPVRRPIQFAMSGLECAGSPWGAAATVRASHT
jgi:hypothetical protein